MFIIVLYFGIVFAIGLYYSRKQNESTKSYFLANRNLGWFAIGASLFAATISSENFIFLTGSGAVSGLAAGNLEWMAVIPLILLGWCIAPLFLKSDMFTVPEFFGKRFNNAARLYLSGITIFSYLFIRISVSLFAGGIIFKEIFGWDVYSSAVLMVVITGIYTILGGLNAVVYTSVVQTFFLLVGTVFLTAFGLKEAGGIGLIQENLPAAHFLLFKPLSDAEFPWAGIILAAPVMGIWYWCTEQYVIQRFLGAKSVNEARRGAIFTGFLKILPLFILVVPGLVAAVLFPGISGEEALPALLYSSILPSGIKGIALAGIISALMASLSSTFISTSTLFTMDFYRNFNPNAPEKKLVLVGRLATTAVVMAAILWIPLVRNFSSLILGHIYSIPAFIGPPVAAVFLLGIFWRRIDGTAALGALVTGGLFGMIRLMHDLLDPQWLSGFGVMDSLLKLNPLYYAIFLFVLSLVVMMAVSFSNRGVVGRRIGETLIYLKDLKPILSGGLTAVEEDSRDRPAWFLSVALVVLLVGLWGLFLY